MKADPELKGYFAEAASWDADRAAQGRRTVRLALGVAGAGWIATLVLAAALMLLMPLKRVEPFVVRVDNATGVVDVVPGVLRAKRSAGSRHALSADPLRDGVRAI